MTTHPKYGNIPSEGPSFSHISDDAELDTDGVITALDDNDQLKYEHSPHLNNAVFGDTPGTGLVVTVIRDKDEQPAGIIVLSLSSTISDADGDFIIPLIIPAKFTRGVDLKLTNAPEYEEVDIFCRNGYLYAETKQTGLDW